jgi:hypothetical protein
MKEVKEAIDKVWNSFKDLPQSQAAGWTLNLAIMSYHKWVPVYSHHKSVL